MWKGQLLSQGLASMNFVTSVKSLHDEMPLLLHPLNKGSSTHHNLHWKLVGANPLISWKWDWWEQPKDIVKPQACESAYSQRFVSPAVLTCSEPLLPSHSLPSTSQLLGSFTTACHVPLTEIWLPGTTAELGFSPNWAVGSRHRSKFLSSTTKTGSGDSQGLGLCPWREIERWKLVASLKGSSMGCPPT